MEPSPDHTLVAYSTDTIGYEKFQLKIRDLASGLDLADVFPESAADIEWGGDNSTIYYMTHDKAMRTNKFWRHRVRCPMLLLLPSFADDISCEGWH